MSSLSCVGPTKFVVIGPVDNGKSTVCGHLLRKAKCVDDREMDKITAKAEEEGMIRWKYARILDSCEEEMARGKTHEYIAIDFQWGDREFQLIDTPGHSTFIRSMISAVTLGAKTACVIVSAQDNEFDAGFNRGTLREHLIIAFTHGVENLVVLCNKMDLVDWSQDKFDIKTRKVAAFARSIGFKSDRIRCIPISGWTGVGLTDCVGLPTWYQSSDMLSLIAELATNPPLRDASEQQVFEGSRLVVDCKFINPNYVYSKGFKCIIHYTGDQGHDTAFETQATIVGIRGSTLIRRGDKTVALWQLQNPIKTTSNRLLFRVDSETVGVGKILQTLA